MSPLLLMLLGLPPPQASERMEQPFVLCPDQTAQLFIAMKNWGFPQQIVNKQLRLLRRGGAVEGEAWQGGLMGLPA